LFFGSVSERIHHQDQKNECGKGDWTDFYEHGMVLSKHWAALEF
jgi:hypothetical protein